MKKEKKSWQQLNFPYCKSAPGILFLMPHRALFSKEIEEGLGAEIICILVYLRNKMLVRIVVCAVLEL